MKTINILTIAALAALAFPAHADDARVTLTTGMDYSSGKYGGTQSTDIRYVPVIAKYESGPWVFKLTAPYISVTAPSGGTVVSVDPSGRLIRRSVGPRATNSGMGDIVTGLTYNVMSHTATQTTLDVTGKIKFGTADKNKGLGTGETDYSVQADLYKTYGQTTALGTLGYRVLGSPAGINLNNVWFGSVGAAYKFNKETNGGLVLDLREPSTSTGATMREVTAYVTHKLGEHYKLQGYALKGFSDASPDWGIGAMVGAVF